MWELLTFYLSRNLSASVSRCQHSRIRALGNFSGKKVSAPKCEDACTLWCAVRPGNHSGHVILNMASLMGEGIEQGKSNLFLLRSVHTCVRGSRASFHKFHKGIFKFDHSRLNASQAGVS